MIRARSFYDYAWDIIEGCEHACSYCYARKELKDFTPKFFPERLQEPYSYKPCKIFVNRHGDIMGSWVHKEDIQAVIDVAKDLKEHEFLFMTKNPKRFTEFEFPPNCILGVTLESPDVWWRAEIMKDIKGRKMASCEPILGNFKGYDFSQFEYVVIGGLMGKGKPRFYNSIKHDNKLMKLRNRIVKI